MHTLSKNFTMFLSQIYVSECFNMKKNYDCDNCILEFSINGAFIGLLCLPLQHAFICRDWYADSEHKEI